MSLAALASGLTDGGLAYQMADPIPQLQVRYPAVPIVFYETRPLAEEGAFRFLGASLTTASPTQTRPHCSAGRRD